MTIKYFKEWKPDIAPLVGGSQMALNTLPIDDGYTQMPVPIKSAPVGFNTTPLKLFVATSPDGIHSPFCFGASYSAVATNFGWQTLANSTFASESWDIVVYGDSVYAVNGIQPYHKISILTTLFGPVDVPNGLTGKRIAIVADFIMLIDIRENLGNQRYPFRAQWSGIARPETFGKLPEVQADYQDVSDIGQLQAIVGGEYGLILGTKGTSRVDYVGGETIFTFSTVEVEVGCDIPNSAVRVGDLSIWHSSRGWRQSIGGASIPIGVGICDRYFKDRIDMRYIDRMSYTIFFDQDIVLYSYVSKSSLDGEPDEALAYNWRLKRFTPGKMRCGILGRSSSFPIFTDDAVIGLPGYNPLTSVTDDYNIPTDSFGVVETGERLSAMVDGALAHLGFPAGIQIDLETEEIEFVPGKMSKLVRFRPIVNGIGNVVGSVKTRDVQTLESYRSRINLIREVDGSMKCNERGRYHTIGLSVFTPMIKGLGIDIVDVFPSGKR